MTERAPQPTVSPDQFRRARSLFESALDWPPAERTKRLQEACRGDSALAGLVAQMLRADATPHRLLDGVPAILPDRWDHGDVFAGRYRIVELIGRGGMGEVYRAHDSELGRDVALKVLPSETVSAASGADDRLPRFRREAQVLASLNHPNIAAIHGVEEDDGIRALVLELVDGPTLAERIAAGRLSLDETIAIARQIAGGLEAAHEQGIVHRDLKPANIKLRPDGTVKLLDFGLAKVVQPATALTSGTATSSPTVTSRSMMQRGVLLGTAAYMSPEQAKGREADRRSDLWAFGAVIFEMLTGERAFTGNDIPETLAAVLHVSVDWARLPANLPKPLGRLLVRCLEPEASRRLRDVGEARIVLDDLASGTSTPSVDREPSPSVPPASRYLPAMLAAALAAGVALGGTFWPRPAPPPVAVTRFALSMSPAQALRIDSQSRDLSITPDGTRVVYKGGARVDRTQLFVQALDELEPRPLTAPGQPKGPFPSPDGQWVGFFEPGPPGAALKKVAITGGPPIDLSRLDGPSRGATWGENDVIVTASGAPTTGLLRVPAAGGPFEVLTRPDRERGEADHLWPHFLPGGRAVLFTITAVSGGIDAAQVAVLELGTRTWRTVIQRGSQAHYLSTGHLVYVAGGALWAVAFDLERLQPVGAARAVVPQVATLATGVAEFDVARDGTLAYVATGGTSSSRRSLMWIDRQGREQPIPAPPRPYASARLSPDGNRIAVEIEDRDNDIWVWDLQRETLTRVTTDPGRDESPVWTRDGSRLAFTSETGGVMGTIFWRPADGSGQPEQLGDGSRIVRASSVTPDGRLLLLSDGTGLTTVALDGSREMRPLTTLARGGGDGAVSPDGRWLAYVELDGASPNVFVSRFAAPDEGRTLVTPEGGAQPRWSPDGRELFYLGLDGTLMSVAVSPGDVFSAARPRPVVEKSYFYGISVSRGATYDVAPDGQRFLMIREDTAAGDPPTVVVVKQWFEELKRLVPVMP